MQGQYEAAIELLEPLSFVMNRMIEQLCARLAARALATNELRLVLGLEMHPDLQIKKQNELRKREESECESGEKEREGARERRERETEGEIER